MAPLIYPEPTWSNGFGRVIRTVKVVAIAGAIGAVGGGIAVMTLVGGSSQHATALRVSTTQQSKADNAKSAMADTAAVGAASAAAAGPQPNAAAPAHAAAAAAQASSQHSPAAAEPTPHVAAVEQHGDEAAAEPAGSAAGTQVSNRAEPDKNVQAHPARTRAKVTRRTRYAEHGRREPPSTDISRYSDARRAPYAAERYSYYDPPPVLRTPQPARGFYFGGGGGFYDRGGGWGD